MKSKSRVNSTSENGFDKLEHLHEIENLAASSQFQSQ